VRWIVVLGLLGCVVGCGSVVVVGDEDALAEDDGASAASGSSGSASGGVGSGAGMDPPDCVGCGDGNCGWCAHEGGDEAYRCANGVSPRADMECESTGNLFVDPGTGEHYICWRCYD
jgi:hypothetical protein